MKAIEYSSLEIQMFPEGALKLRNWGCWGVAGLTRDNLTPALVGEKAEMV